MSEDYRNDIDKLFDEDNTDTITLYNQNGEPTEFEQVALIPLNEKIYVILKPITPIPGLGEDEGLVFSVEEIDDEDTLVLVVDEGVVDAVFDVYNSLLEEN